MIQPLEKEKFAPIPTAEASFNWEDPFLIADQLSDEERIVSDSAKEFCSKELMPIIKEAHRNEVFDRNIMKLFGSNGFLGPTISSDFGGADLNYVSYGLITREVESIDSGYRSAMSVQSSLVMHPISAFGTAEQKKSFYHV